MSEAKPTNRLVDETSPYLLQHAHNPVDWYPWGDEALEKARREDRPIFLSIGYAACHWCHVMERESFEDAAVAEILNDEFVPIKVDREERPDLDDVYMKSVMMMTGQGGWPLSVFLTPELKPFYGGTYFPPSDRQGMPSFRTVLRSVLDAYRNKREQIEEAGDHVSDKLREHAGRSGGGVDRLSEEPVQEAVQGARGRFDAENGGFSGAPKFPQAGILRLLLRVGARRDDGEAMGMATRTLDCMADGGLFDHLGGGFHRYAVDERWLVPHFEKMLYDNAQLAYAYVEAHQVTSEERYARVARRTLDWTIRRMQGEHGGYFSSLDADSEGEEGKYYVWTREEVEELLDEDDAHAFALAYDITDVGNWEGVNIPNRIERPLDEVADELDTDVDSLRQRLRAARSTLLEARQGRVLPGLDDKVLTDWNGLMIAAMAKAHRVLGDDRYLESARRAADFLFDRLVRDGDLLHTWREGEAKVPGYLDDHANLLAGCVELYESTFELVWLRRARQLADRLIGLFRDREDGGFFFTGPEHDELITRPKRTQDSSTPSGNGVAVTYLQRLETLTGHSPYGERAAEALRWSFPRLRQQGLAHSQLLLGLDYRFRSPTEIVVVGAGDDESTRRSLRRLWRRFAPNAVVVLHDPDAPEAEAAREELPLLQGKTAAEARGGAPTFYVCENYACQAPTDDFDEALEALRA